MIYLLLIKLEFYEKKLKNLNLNIILFVIEAVNMIIELAASRILSPYFGNSNIIWTSIIGIILLSNSLGSFLGGTIADKKDNDKSLNIILICISILTMIIPIMQKSILSLIISLIKDIKIGAIVSTIILFLPVSIILGMLLPIILKKKSDDNNKIGRVSGKTYAIATIGGIFGTFIAGFYLLPNFGVTVILYSMSLIVAFLCLTINKKMIMQIILVIVMIVNIIFIIDYQKKQNINIEILLNNKNQKETENINAEFDSEYGHIMVYDNVRDNREIRTLKVNEGYESFMYKDNPYELASNYLKYYDYMFSTQINDVLMIGGGGYSYPKYFISHYQDKIIDVIEIDSKVTEIAKKYFYLDKLIKDYNLNETKRLNIITEDGRVYLNNNSKKYDAILNDAFKGYEPARTLTTVEAVKKIQDSLNKNGIYITNIVQRLNSEFLLAEVNTIKKVFKHVYVLPVENEDLTYFQNIIVIASNNELKLNYNYNLKIPKNTIILTDEYNPIEKLVEY